MTGTSLAYEARVYKYKLPRLVLVPGILTIIEGWLNEWVNVETVMAELTEVILLT
jgi:hypothetical protein